MTEVASASHIQSSKQVPETSFESQFTGTPPLEKSQHHHSLDHAFSMEATAEDLERERSHSRSAKHEKNKSGHHTPAKSGHHTPAKSGHHTPVHGEHHEHPLAEKIVKALFEPPHPPEFDPHAHHNKAEKRKSHEHHRPDLKSILSFGHSSDHHNGEEKTRKSMEKHEKRNSGEQNGEHHKHPHLEKIVHDMFDPPHPTDRPQPIFHHSHSHAEGKKTEKRKSGEHAHPAKDHSDLFSFEATKNDLHREEEKARKSHELAEKRKSGEHAHPAKDHSDLFSFEATKNDLHHEEEKARKSHEKAEARKSGEHHTNVEQLWSFEATAADRKHEEEKARRHLKCDKGKCVATEEQGKTENCPHEHERTEIERKASPKPHGIQGLIPDGTYGPV